MNASPGPLDGVLVLDLTRVLAGPFATLCLADLGARVIKVERPGTGDDSRAYGPFAPDGRSYYFARVNRGKESLAVDLKDPAGLALVRRIAARADVLVESFRPGVMGRLGLGAEEVRAANRRLVYASISGFGQTGPWAQRPAYDAVVQALAGTVAITGRPGEGSVKPGVPISDLSAGLYAFGGISAALLGAARTGQGATLDIAMYDATVSLLEGAALRWLATGAEPPLIGDAHQAIAPFDTYATADGRIVICAANDALWGVLCAALDAPALLARAEYATNAGRHAHLGALRADLEAALATGTTDSWVERLGAAGLPCGTVASVGEALSAPQVAARGMLVEADGLRLPGQPLLSGRGPRQVAAAPALDEHGSALRVEFAAG